MVSSRFLSNDDLLRAAPSIFATEAHDSRSGRYAYIPTVKVIDGMRGAGFQPVKVQCARVRDQGRHGFEKHMIRFRHVDSAIQLGEAHPEVVLINSHDGSTSYKLMAGLFRLVCLNGLVIPQGDMDELCVKHLGSEGAIVRQVINGSHRILTQAGAALETASRWGQLQLSETEQSALAIGAHHLRFADPAGNIDTPIEPAQLLRARRGADQKTDLWTTFNRVQENAIKGGLHGIGRDAATGRRRHVTTREVKGIDGNVNLNKAIWKLAEHLAATKTAAPTQPAGDSPYAFQN